MGRAIYVTLHLIMALNCLQDTPTAADTPSHPPLPETTSKYTIPSKTMPLIPLIPQPLPFTTVIPTTIIGNNKPHIL